MEIQTPTMKVLDQWSKKQAVTLEILSHLDGAYKNLVWARRAETGRLGLDRPGRIVFNQKYKEVIEDHRHDVSGIVYGELGGNTGERFMLKGLGILLRKAKGVGKKSDAIQYAHAAAKAAQEDAKLSAEDKKLAEVSAVEIELITRRVALRNALLKDKVLGAILPTIHRGASVREAVRVKEALEDFAQQTRQFYVTGPQRM